MRYINIQCPPHLPRKWYVVRAARLAHVNAAETRDVRSSYIKKNSSWNLLKSWLGKASGEKCWYCEAKLARATFDVDHFRPKLGVTVDGVRQLSHAGYYWLAYEWWNFRLSCQRCNRPEKNEAGDLHGKANEFPIRDEAQRCLLPGGSLDMESPRLLDPCVEADCQLLAYGVDGEVKPATLDGCWEHQRARFSIDLLGLNDWNTPEIRRNSWRLLDDLIRLAGNNPTVISHIKECLSFNHEYSSFFRSAIGTHRDKSWVEALL